MARAGGDKRGSNADRKRRREWLISPGAGTMIDGVWIDFGGDGSEVDCYWKCGRKLNVYIVEADRIVPGGSYRRDNIVPACRPCNLARSDHGWLIPKQIAEQVAATTAKRGGLVPALVG